MPFSASLLPSFHPFIHPCWTFLSPSPPSFSLREMVARRVGVITTRHANRRAKNGREDGGESFFLSLSLFFRTLRHRNIVDPERKNPTNNALSINFPTELRRKIFVNKAPTEHANRAPNEQKRVCNVYIFRLSFHFACHRWWLGRRKLPAQFCETS